MIEPVLRDAALLADIEAAGEGARDSLHLWWLGQSGFLLKWRERHYLLDPYLSDSLTKKYAHTDKPHVRMTARALDPAALGRVKVIACTHGHTDHLDPDTLRPLLSRNPDAALVVPEAVRDLAGDRVPPGFANVIGLDDGIAATIGDLTIIGIAAAHEEIERDPAGHCRFLGYVLRLGDWTLYHSGDCLAYEGLGERLRAYQVTLALLPINGRAPERRVAGNMTGGEAVALARQMEARCVIPCHYDMFEFNTVSPAGFIAAAEELGQPYQVLRCGERWTLH